MPLDILKQNSFGQPLLVQLRNSSATTVTITTIGASITSLVVHDKDGKPVDIVLGYDNIEQYKSNTVTYFGATVGRNANRIENAQFSINGSIYKMTPNEGDNNLHSGPNGYQIRDWTFSSYDERSNKLTLTLSSPNGDQGYPGNLEMTSSFQLTENNQLIISYTGMSDADTIFNPTNHTYFNLNGHNSGSIEQHQLCIHASHFTPVKNTHSIPTGELQAVQQTPFNFLQPKEIGRDINNQDEQLSFTGGYDHNWALDKPILTEIAATLIGNQSKIKLDVSTNLPGIQFYSGNFLADEPGKDQVQYQKRGGLCLETQFFPNAINTPSFPSPLLTAHTPKEYTTCFQFGLAD